MIYWLFLSELSICPSSIFLLGLVIAIGVVVVLSLQQNFSDSPLKNFSIILREYDFCTHFYKILLKTTPEVIKEGFLIQIPIFVLVVLANFVGLSVASDKLSPFHHRIISGFQWTFPIDIFLAY